MLCQAGRLADKIQVDFKTYKIICYRLKYLDLYFIDISAILLKALEVHFSQLFSNKTYFRVCFEMHKIQLPFFSYRSLLLGTNVSNDMYTNAVGIVSEDLLDIVIYVYATQV